MYTQNHLIQNRSNFNLAQIPISYDYEISKQEIKDMAFVNELIPEAEKDKFTFPVSTRRDGSKPTLWKWTIDRERDAYLVFVNAKGGGYEGTPVTKNFILNWGGNLISLSTEPLGASDAPEGAVMNWRIHHLNIPVELQDQKEQVLSLIKEAFTIMGDLYDGEQYFAVNINFDIPSSN